MLACCLCRVAAHFPCSFHSALFSDINGIHITAFSPSLRAVCIAHTQVPLLRRWTREWTAEENRHGDLMNKYCMLSGRVNMKAVEVTIQNLIGSGMDPKTENNPYLGFIYTSFQERATKISHGTTARHAKEYGDKVLGQITGAIASDEGRHESAYCRIVDELFRK